MTKATQRKLAGIVQRRGQAEQDKSTVAEMVIAGDVTPFEAAYALGVSTQTVYNWVKEFKAKK